MKIDKFIDFIVALGTLFTGISNTIKEYNNFQQNNRKSQDAIENK